MANCTKLTEEEITILKRIDSDYYLIERDIMGDLHLYVLDEELFSEENRPYYGNKPRCLYFPYKHLFNMIPVTSYNPMLITDVIRRFS
jgi:hypothetical protein